MRLCEGPPPHLRIRRDGYPSARPLEVLARLLIASGGTVTGGAAIVDGSAYWGSGYCGTLCLGSSTPLLNNNKVYAFSLR